jgi:hypothetical protein
MIHVGVGRGAVAKQYNANIRRALVTLASLWICVGNVERAHAAGPFEQTVKVEITAVRGRGANANRSQYVDVTIDGTTERLDLLHGCMDFNGCVSHQIDPATCLPGSGSDPAMNDVTGRWVGSLIGPASFSKDVSVGGLACDTSDPRILGHIDHFHRFAVGSDTLVDVVVLDVDLDGPAEVDACHFQEGQPWNGGNVSGITYTISTDDNQTRGDLILDSDGDGFPDHDETYGVDTDCDGRVDIYLNQPTGGGGWHDVPPDPTKPDLYVEADWMDCNLPRNGQSVPSCDPIVDASGNPDRRTFEPNWLAFEDVVEAFAAHDIILHIMPGEAIPVIGKFVGNNNYALPDDKDEGSQNAQLVYDLYFGTPSDRIVQSWRAYKKAHARYAMFNYSPPGPGGHGNAFDQPSGAFRVGWHPDFVRDENFWQEIVTPYQHQRELATIFMHELGHALGLGHGGQDPNYQKPNQFSVMTYKWPRLDDLATPFHDKGLDYNALPNVLDMCALSESAPIVANAPIDWATTWTCPDNAKRGTGTILGTSSPNLPAGNDWDCDGVLGEVHSGTPTSATCLALHDFICVTPGSTARLETTPAPGDVFLEATIWDGGDGVLDTPMAVDAFGNALDVLTLDQTITEGPDGSLDSYFSLDPQDELVYSGIYAGPDLVCNTTALPTDAQNIPVGHPTDADCGNHPCSLVEAVDEWAIVLANLTPTGNFSGLYQGPPLLKPVEPTPDELRAGAKASARADVALSSSITVGVGGHGRQAELTYDVTNFGPHAAVEPTVEVRLPAGTDLVRCQVPGGTCYQHGDIVVAGWSSLSSNETGSIELEVLLGCDGSGGGLEIPARLHTVSFDPEPSNNQALDSVALEPGLAIGEPGNPWVKSWANGQAMPVVASDRGPALALTCGYQTFESPPFDTYELGAGGTQLLVDLYIPQAAWGGWVGEITLFFEAPGLNIWNRAQATKPLTALARGQWVTVAFPLDAVTRGVLLSNTPSARFRLASNLSKCGPTVKLAQVRVGGTLTCQAPVAATESITSSSVLRFESMADWSSPGGTVALESGQVSEGAHALRLGPTPWMRLESRFFQADELVDVSSRLALDVLVPELPAGASWLGGLGLLVDCPEANLHNRWVGYHALQFLFGDEFNRLEYSLPPDVVTILGTPGNECRFAFELTSNPSFGSFVLDGGGFLPEVP